jgi:hypothetical protein
MPSGGFPDLAANDRSPSGIPNDALSSMWDSKELESRVILSFSCIRLAPHHGAHIYHEHEKNNLATQYYHFGHIAGML